MPHGRSPRKTHASRPILMTYDGDFLDVEELQLSGEPLHYVLVDLRGSKSTTGMSIHRCASLARTSFETSFEYPIQQPAI